MVLCKHVGQSEEPSMNHLCLGKAKSLTTLPESLETNKHKHSIAAVTGDIPSMQVNSRKT